MSFIVIKNFQSLLSNIRYSKNQNIILKALLSTNPNHKDFGEQHEQQSQKNHQSQSTPEINTKLLKVAVIGVPNAGKSTFINNLINHRVCPTSNKVHTTKGSNRAIYTIKDTQLILYDTPGLVTEREIKKHHLESSFSSAYKHSIQHGNMICVIHDVSNTWQRNELHSTVLNTLNAYKTFPSILILNKIDCLKSKRVLLDLIKILTNNTLSGKRKQSNNADVKRNSNEIQQKSMITNNMENSNYGKNEKPVGWDNFSNVFMVSSITGDGLHDILQFLLKNAQPNKWEFPADTYTDQTPENIIVDSVRARLLDYLPQEIPYSLTNQLEYYNEDKGIIYASVQVTCPNSRIEKLICGVMNGKLKQITERVTSDLVETFGKTISITITTNVAKKNKN